MFINYFGLIIFASKNSVKQTNTFSVRDFCVYGDGNMMISMRLKEF